MFTTSRRLARPVFLFCAALAAFLALPGAAAIRTEPYAWASVAIRGGGLVSGLVFHPAQRDLLYARTDVGGAYRWDAGHQRWIPLNDNIGHALSQLLGVISLALDPRDPRQLYLACGSYLQEWSEPGAILWSPDQGATWNRTPLPFKLGGNQDGRTAGERLAVDPHDGRVLLLGSNQDGLWRSSDQAATWSRVSGFPAGSLTFVLFDPRSGPDGKATPVIYAGANDLAGPALYHSSDAGKTWAPVPGQPRGLLIQHAELDAAGTLYLTCANGLGPNGITAGAVWKLETAAGRWTDITPIPPEPAIKDAFGYAGLALDAQHPGTLLVGTLDRWTRGDEIFRSTDGGATWKPMLAQSTWDYASAPYVKTMKPHWIGDIALDPYDADHALFVTGYGIWSTVRARAIEHGEPTPWVFTNRNLEETVVTALVSPPEGARLLSTFGDVGGFRHDDLTASPAAGSFTPSHGSNPGVDFAENLPAKLVRTHWGPAHGALSEDGGSTWKDFPTAPAAATAHGPGIAALSADGRRIVWLPKGSSPWFSTDDGATWTQSRSDLVATKEWTTYGPAADRVNPLKFYIYDSITGRIHVSTDGGVSFASSQTLPAGGGLLRAEPGREGSVWLPAPDGLYHSVDSGASFTRIAHIDSAQQVGFGRAATNGNGPAVFLAGKIGDTDAVFRSDDGAKTWVRLNDGRLRFGWISAITGDPRKHGRVYVGTGGRGIFVGEPAKP
jgi:photosystem II stability/assembly factor-like uncharacterized protein